MGTDLDDYQKVAIDIAKAVSEDILEIYYKARQFDVQTKADNSPLTQADLIAHEKIIAGLTAFNSAIPILSEEDAEISYGIRSQWSRYWLVDPLDGTKDFLRRSGEFTINIALMDNHKPVVGIIYVPVLQELYYAGKNLGAFKQCQEEIAIPIHTRSLPERGVRIAVGHGYKIEKLQSYLNFLKDYEIVEAGSALKFGLVAEGAVDIYPRLGPTSEWDTAAGQLIVEEAGGAVVDFDDQPLRYNKSSSLLNSHFLAVGDKKTLDLLGHITIKN